MQPTRKQASATRLSAMRLCAMQPSEFAAYHLPALERDEARHNLIIAVLQPLLRQDRFHPRVPVLVLPEGRLWARRTELNEAAA